MNLLKNFKLNYNIKLFKDYLLNEKYEAADEIITRLQQKNDLEFFSFLKLVQGDLIKLNSNFFKHKIIWNISYDLIDTNYLNNFLNFYLSKNSKSSYTNKIFASALGGHLSSLQVDQKNYDIKFNDFLINSNFYQNLLQYKFKKEFIFLNTTSSFFETNKNNYFIYPNTTFCYFYIIRNPNDIFIRYKNIYKSTEGAYDEIFNFSKKEFLSPDQKDLEVKVYENRTNYNINVKSWKNQNVLNTYRGKIIEYENLIKNTDQVLAEIIYHLKQYGFNVDVNMNDIQYFVSQNKIDNGLIGNISKSEQKFLEKNLANFTDPY